MEKKTTKVTEEIQEIPKYEKIYERRRCKNCIYRYQCYMPSSRSETGAKIYCNSFAKKFYTVEMLLFIALEIFGLFKIHSMIDDFEKFIFVAAIYIVAILVLEIIIVKAAKFISENKEIKRKIKFDKKVEKIKKSNEEVKRKQNGETKEFCDFKEEMDKLTGELTKCMDKIKTIRIEFEENDEVNENLLNLMEELYSLNVNVNPENYNLNLIQVFYKSYLKAFVDKTYRYQTLCDDNKITRTQIVEYNSLLKNVTKKVAICLEVLTQSEEENFLDEIKKLITLMETPDSK